MTLGSRGSPAVIGTDCEHKKLTVHVSCFFKGWGGKRELRCVVQGEELK